MTNNSFDDFEMRIRIEKHTEDKDVISISFVCIGEDGNSFDAYELTPQQLFFAVKAHKIAADILTDVQMVCQEAERLAENEGFKLQ